MSVLEGRVCVVTGASRGLGRVVALLMAEPGAAVVGTYRSGADAAREVEATVAPTGGTLAMEHCDVTDVRSVQRLVEVVLERHARIHGLVNNAGVWRSGRLVDLPAEDWQQVMDADLPGVFTVVQAVLPAMLEARSGRIANVTSVIGITGYLGATTCSAAKGGVDSLTRSLAKKSSSGAAVNAVAPGRVETDMTAQLGERARARAPRAHPDRPPKACGRGRLCRRVAMDPLYLTWRRHSG